MSYWTNNLNKTIIDDGNRENKKKQCLLLWFSKRKIEIGKNDKWNNKNISLENLKTGVLIILQYSKTTVVQNQFLKTFWSQKMVAKRGIFRRQIC
jgi:hypothetical protein